MSINSDRKTLIVGNTVMVLVYITDADNDRTIVRAISVMSLPSSVHGMLPPVTKNQLKAFSPPTPKVVVCVCGHISKQCDILRWCSLKYHILDTMVGYPNQD